MSITRGAPAPQGRAAALLRLPDFRRLLRTRLLSQLTDGVFQVSLASYVVFSPERQPTPGAIASAFAVMLLPFCVIGPFAGPLLDRWRRRQILLYGNLVRLLLCLGTAALVLMRVPTPVFFGAALLVTGANRFVLAGLSAALPQVVPAALLIGANAIAPTLGTIASTVGGGSGFLVRLVLPGGPEANAALLVLAALGYGSAAMAAATMGPDLLGPDLSERAGRAREPLLTVVAATGRGLLAGLRHLVHDCRPAAWALGAVTVCRFCYGLLLVLLLMLCRNTFAAPDDQAAGIRWLGLALAASAAGFFAAALLTPVATRRIGVSGWLVACAAMAAVLTPALGLSFAPVPIITAAFLLGLVSQGIKISTDTVVQTSVEDDYRGRVFAVYDVLFNASLVAAAAVAAVVMSPSGRSVALVLGSAALYAATAVGYGLTLRHRPPLTPPLCPPVPSDR
ncbi:MFS transporter [Streptacidiphilus carbonis]|uniref:MFS transporter n=1 Tax=Streptacidiphilus carbonis TaxID=105422 RepID=UPI000AFE76B5|nr:MFS transporter [Streptacidiphilus carbonis]